MSKIKVTSANALTIQLSNGIILGANKHPNFFSTKGGFQVTNVKVGDEVDLPEEAICTSTTTGKKFVVGSLNLEQMQTLDAKLGIQIKKKQMLL